MIHEIQCMLQPAIVLLVRPHILACAIGSNIHGPLAAFALSGDLRAMIARLSPHSRVPTAIAGPRFSLGCDREAFTTLARPTFMGDPPRHEEESGMVLFEDLSQ
ncbi:hypothetical protein KY289_013371 [Solanum tuberosum]|nr:hypothetical protein KY289_013371 [Solanum tuberosum]